MVVHCSGSVYELIKKALVSLRLDLNTLATTVQTLRQQQREALMRQGQIDAHTAEMSSIWASVVALEERVNKQEAKLASLQPEVQAALADVLKVCSQCTFVGCNVMWVLHRTFPNFTSAMQSCASMSLHMCDWHVADLFAACACCLSHAGCVQRQRKVETLLRGGLCTAAALIAAMVLCMFALYRRIQLHEAPQQARNGHARAPITQ